MLVTLVLNDPPGGRCRLYRAYAAALAAHADASCTEVVGSLPDQPAIHAPAILIDGTPVHPSDGVILAPEDIGTVIGRSQSDISGLVAKLEDALEKLMQEWS